MIKLLQKIFPPKIEPVEPKDYFIDKVWEQFKSLSWPFWFLNVLIILSGVWGYVLLRRQKNCLTEFVLEMKQNLMGYINLLDQRLQVIEEQAEEHVVPGTALAPAPAPTSVGDGPVQEEIPNMPTPSSKAPTPTNLSPTPSNLSPTPSNLSPTPANLSPTPSNLSPTPSNLSPTPSNLSPTPSKLIPNPTNLSPTPSKLIPSTTKLMTTPPKMQSNPSKLSQPSSRKTAAPTKIAPPMKIILPPSKTTAVAPTPVKKKKNKTGTPAKGAPTPLNLTPTPPTPVPVEVPETPWIVAGPSVSRPPIASNSAPNTSTRSESPSNTPPSSPKIRHRPRICQPISREEFLRRLY